MLIGVPIFIYIMNVLSIDYRKAMEAESVREAAIAAEKNAEKVAARNAHVSHQYPKDFNVPTKSKKKK